MILITYRRMAEARKIAPSKTEEVYEPQAVLERHYCTEAWLETLES